MCRFFAIRSLPLYLVLLTASALALADDHCGLSYSQMGKSDLEKLVLEDSDRSLLLEQMKISSPEDARAWNETLIEAANSSPVSARNPGRMSGLSQLQLQNLLRIVKNHPVATSSLSWKYAPNGGIGFCFGRAITAHIEALRMGVSKDSIKKIWIVGGMESGSTKWGHHVATIVRGDDGLWYTIDPNYSSPLKLADWYQKIQTGYRNDGKLQLFITNAKRYSSKGGVDAGPILPSTVKDPFYNHYFEDLMAQSRKEAHEALELKRAARSACTAGNATAAVAAPPNLGCLGDVLQSQLVPDAEPVPSAVPVTSTGAEPVTSPGLATDPATAVEPAPSAVP